MKLTETERTILENTNEQCKYIARDYNGILYVYSSKPKKHSFFWLGDGLTLSLEAFTHLFQSVQCEDEEPYKFR